MVNRRSTFVLFIAAAIILPPPVTARAIGFELTLKIPFGYFSKSDALALDEGQILHTTVPLLSAGIRTRRVSFSLGAGIGRFDNVYDATNHCCTGHRFAIHLIAAPTLTIDVYHPVKSPTALYLLAAALLGASDSDSERGTAPVAWHFEYGAQLAAGIKHRIHPHLALGGELGSTVQQYDNGSNGLTTLFVLYIACVATLPFGE